MPLRCVIVDDNLGFLHAARLLLEQEGLQVVGVATSGDEALRAVAELRPDVTLLDIDLGSESGFDVARRLADDRDSGPGRLILISTHSEEDLVDLIAESPAIGFLGKPSLSAATIKGLLENPGSPS
jgi:two-component system, NarL family, nitrate/nitrite response regulator NarL